MKSLVKLSRLRWKWIRWLMAVHVTADHHVTLTGAARSPEEREAAENDAWCVAGTRSVDNRLEVVPIGAVEAPARPGG
ncbi:MAG: hypothetical protein C4346_14875 [Chloroflexota bacterium]